MPRLAMYLFGAPRVELDGVPVTIRRRKALALLAYLALTGQSHSRDVLATLFWPNSDEVHAHMNLRNCLAELRRGLGPTWLETDRTHVFLTPSQELWLDVGRFRSLLADCQSHGHPPHDVCPKCLPPLNEADSLYLDDFLRGFTLPDCPDFDEWQRFQTEGLRFELADLLGRLGQGYAAEGDDQAAIACTRRWVALDPLHEPAQRQLMQLYAQSGQPSAALRQYEAYVGTLEDALGTSAGREIAELYLAIRAMPGQQPPGSTAPPFPGEEALDAPAQAQPPLFLSEEAAVDQDGPLFVAREQKLAQLNAFLDAALAGRGQVIFVTGEAGSGKTALLHAFARRAQARYPDLIVAHGVCDLYAGLGDPYLPFRDIMAMLTGDIETQWATGVISRDQALRLWRLLPEAVQALVEKGPDLLDTFVAGQALAGRAVTHTPKGSPWQERLQALLARSMGQSPNQSRLFEEYTDVLQALAAWRPLLLLLDDLHWADISSLSLLYHLARRVENCPILIIGAYRPEDLALAGKSHPLQEMIGELQGRHGQIELSLDQALRAEGRHFVDALLDTQPNWLDEDFRQALFRHSRGQALFTVELVRDLRERGHLAQDARGRWVATPALAWDALPARVEGVIERRISRLEEELREALRVASVEGENFTAEVVAQVQDLDEQGLIRRLSAELEKRHHLVRAQGVRRLGLQRLSRYRFRHNLFQRYLYGTLDDVERAYLHEAVGVVLEELYRDQADEIAAVAGQLARHFEEAGLMEKAVDYRYQAGGHATRLSANQEAIEHLCRGLITLAALPDTPERIQRELSFQVALGVPVTATHGYAHPEVEKVYSRALELCRRVGDTPQLFPTLYGLWRYYLVRAELQTALHLGGQLMRLAQPAGERALWVEAERAMGINLFHLGELVLAREHLERGLDLYDFQADRWHALVYGHDPAVSCLGYLAHTLWLLGYPDQALAKVEQLLNLAQRLSHPFSQAHAWSYGAAQTYQLRREIGATHQQAQAGLTLATEQGYPFWIARATILRGWALSRQGREKEGAVQIREGVSAWQDLGAGVAQPYHQGLLAEVYGTIGQIRAGLTILDEALALVQKNGERWWEAELHRLRGELLSKQIGPEEQVEVETEVEISFQRAIELARRQEARSLELRATVSLSRLWQTRGQIEEARAMLADIYNWFSEGFDTPDLREAKALLDQLTVSPC